jgi:2-polyprenyl-3-methyl-5-hydroxy-6-metoxy-1,4-benzoquinol methylase
MTHWIITVQRNNTVSSDSNYKFDSEEALHTHTYLSPLIISLCKVYRATKVLDLGCGNGALVKSIASAGFNVIGCDPSESGIYHATEAIPEAKFYRLGVYDDPNLLEEGDFDVVVSTEVVEHLFYPRFLPRFAAKKLKSGGRIILSTPYHGYVKNLALSLTNRWDTHHTALWDGGHIKFWSRSTLASLIESEGFEFERFIGCGRIPYLWKSMIVVGRKVVGT